MNGTGIRVQVVITVPDGTPYDQVAHVLEAVQTGIVDDLGFGNIAVTTVRMHTITIDLGEVLDDGDST